MSPVNRVVARYRDGRVEKGTALDLDPAKPIFHLRPVDGGTAAPVRLEEMKCVFFVRTFDGDAAHDEELAIAPDDPRARGSSVVAFKFEDGETIVGIAFRFPPNRPFHFIVPVDAGSNNVRILVNQAAVTEMERVA